MDKKKKVKRVVYLTQYNSKDPVAKKLTLGVNDFINSERTRRLAMGPRIELLPAKNGDTRFFVNGMIFRYTLDNSVVVHESYNRRSHGPIRLSDFEWNGYDWQKKKVYI